jgi:acetylornithine deacetylase
VAESHRNGPEDPGSCFNLGIVTGGSKSNVIAGEAFVHWSARLRPGASNRAFLDEIRDCDPDGGASWEVPFMGPPLPADGQDDRAARAFCARHGLPSGEAVDFWTEASLFSAAGLPALVLGPGDIAQAHTADEWVDLRQLETACDLYASVVRGDG